MICLVVLILLDSLNLYSQSNVKIVYKAPGFLQKALTEDIVLHQNLRYGPIPDSIDTPLSDRLLDIYLPKNVVKGVKLPLFLFIHGGGFSGGDKGLTDFCLKIAQQGYAVASINYRLSLRGNKVPGAGCGSNMSKGLPVNGTFHPLLQSAVSNASEDAALALRWLKKNANEYNLDPGNAIVCGGSAGAMTALHLAYQSGQSAFKIKAVVNLWGGLENSGVIKKGAPPLLTFHGDLDDIIHIDYAYALHKRMNEIGSAKSKINILKDKGHAQYKLITETKITEIADFLKNL